jgi:mannose-6-phosphate isomerase-like protein (cupin superfamily)
LVVVDGHGRVRRQTSQDPIGKGQWTMVNADETIYLENDQNFPLTVIRIQTLMQPE